MEALTLLKQWRRRRATPTSPLLSDSVTIADTVSKIETDDDESSSSAEDEGPFFDLEFQMPDDDGNEEQQQQQEGSGEKQQRLGDGGDDDDAEEVEEFNFPVPTGVAYGNDDETDVSLSPSDDLFFKGRLVVPLNSTISPGTKPLFLPVSFFKSATRLRVFMSALKKSRTVDGSGAATEVETLSPGREPPRQKRQLFAVKFRKEDVPIISFFNKEGTGKGDNATRAKETEENDTATAAAMLVEEKRFSKEIVHKYLQKMRPLYPRVNNKHNAGKQSTTATNDSNNAGSAATEEKPPEEEVEGGVANPAVGTSQKKLVQVASHLPAGLRVAYKNLVKGNNSKSSSAAVGSSPTSVLMRRRDDSLLQQQDGIQSAIAHCKNSLINSSKGLGSAATTLTAPEKNEPENCKEDCDIPYL